MRDTPIEFESPFLLCASPRVRGNSDLASVLYSRGFKERGGEITPVYLRDYDCLPCVACGACAKEAQRGMSLERVPLKRERSLRFGCPLTLRDTSPPLLDRLLRARHICIVSPVYFYHLPALFKAFIDRTQPFWELRQAKDHRILSLPPRKCQVVLIAARKKGAALFEGSLKTLKYTLDNLNIELAEPLFLHGLDAPADLAENPSSREQIVRYGKEGMEILHA